MNINWDEYPMLLTPAHVKKIMGLPHTQTYELFKSKAFPSERIGCKHVIPKPRFMKWLGLDQQRQAERQNQQLELSARIGA